MARKLVLDLPDGHGPVLEEVQAADELQLQEKFKSHPELLPLEELGLVGPAVVVGRESALESGRVDLVLLADGGELVVVEFKTGPQNPDFRECLAQLLDYGSDLWGMSLEEFETRVAQSYFKSSHCPVGTVLPGASLADVVAAKWGPAADDAVDWRERLRTQLRDGNFHYVAVAQRFTPSVLRTVQYLNATMKAARFSAVEFVRFGGEGFGAFEARYVAGAGRAASPGATSSKTALAGVEEFLAAVTDDAYRHSLQDLFEGLAGVDGLSVFWGTTGCSLRVAVPGRGPLSIGWLFPPGPPRWMGLTDVTLGWYQDANGLNLSPTAEAGLETYRAAIEALPGGTKPKSSAVRGRTFGPEAVVLHVAELEEAVRAVTHALLADSV